MTDITDPEIEAMARALKLDLLAKTGGQLPDELVQSAVIAARTASRTWMRENGYVVSQDEHLLTYEDAIRLSVASQFVRREGDRPWPEMDRWNEAYKKYCQAQMAAEARTNPHE